MADATKTKLEAVSAELLILEAMYPKTKIFINGFIKAHIIPANACLYRTKKSRLAKLFSKLLYLSISLKEKKEFNLESIIILLFAKSKTKLIFLCLHKSSFIILLSNSYGFKEKSSSKYR